MQETNELRDQLSIETPELVDLRFPIAGVGSRSLALLIDGVLQGVAFIGLSFLIASGASDKPPTQHISTNWALAFVILFAFALQWGYFTLFEAFWHGQTPGKRIVSIRVIQQSGRPIGLFESMTRNFIRFVDTLPGFYAVGIISILVTKKQQRLGDLAAGTLVVHARKAEKPAGSSGNRTLTAALQEAPSAQPVLPSGAPADGLARISPQDLHMIERFLDRRLDLPMQARSSLAQKIAEVMSEKMQHPKPAETSDETFLEGIAHDRRGI